MERTDGRLSPGDTVYNVPFLTGAAGTVPINQLPMNRPPAGLGRGGEGEKCAVFAFASGAAQCPLESLMLSPRLEAMFWGSCIQMLPTGVPPLFSQEASVDGGALPLWGSTGTPEALLLT